MSSFPDGAAINTAKQRCSRCRKDKPFNCFLLFEEIPPPEPLFPHHSQVLSTNYPLISFSFYSFFLNECLIRFPRKSFFTCSFQVLVPTSALFLQPSQSTVTQSVHSPSHLDFPLSALNETAETGRQDKSYLRSHLLKVRLAHFYFYACNWPLLWLPSRKVATNSKQRCKRRTSFKPPFSIGWTYLLPLF